MKREEACQKIMDVRDIKKSTQENICSNLKMFSKDLDEDDISKMLNEYKKVETYLNNKKGRGNKGLSINTLKTYYISLRTSSVVLGSNKAAIDFYNKKMMEFAVGSDNQKDASEVPEKFEDGKLPPWSDMEELPAKFTGNKEKYSLNHMIVSLYVMQPPRRLEYRTMYFLKEKPAELPSVKPRIDGGDVAENGIPYNYIYPVEDVFEVVLQDYKTIRKRGFGVFKDKLSKELSEVVEGYIDKQKIQDKQPMFATKSGKNKGTPFSSSSFSKKLADAFGVHYTKVSITEQNIRNIYITSNVEGKNLSLGDKKKLAYKMGHTITTQQAYIQNQSPVPQEDSDVAESSQGIVIEPIEPELEEQQAETNAVPDEPSVEVLEQLADDKITKEDVLRSIKKYYDLKVEYMQKKLAMLDKML